MTTNVNMVDLRKFIEEEFKEFSVDLHDKIENVVTSFWELAFAVNGEKQLKEEKVKAIVSSVRSLVNVMLLE